MTNEIRIQMYDVEGKGKFATSDTFAMAFLLDSDSVVAVIDDLIDLKVDEFDDMFIADPYEFDGEHYEGYLITPEGAILLAKEFGRVVEPKREIDLDGLLDAAIKTRIECEQTYQDVKKTNDEIRRLFGS